MAARVMMRRAVQRRQLLRVRQQRRQLLAAVTSSNMPLSPLEGPTRFQFAHWEPSSSLEVEFRRQGVQNAAQKATIVLTACKDIKEEHLVERADNIFELLSNAPLYLSTQRVDDMMTNNPQALLPDFDVAQARRFLRLAGQAVSVADLSTLLDRFPSALHTHESFEQCLNLLQEYGLSELEAFRAVIMGPRKLAFAQRIRHGSTMLRYRLQTLRQFMGPQQLVDLLTLSPEVLRYPVGYTYIRLFCFHLANRPLSASETGHLLAYNSPSWEALGEDVIEELQQVMQPLSMHHETRDTPDLLEVELLISHALANRICDRVKQLPSDLVHGFAKKEANQAAADAAAQALVHANAAAASQSDYDLAEDDFFFVDEVFDDDEDEDEDGHEAVDENEKPGSAGGSPDNHSHLVSYQVGTETADTSDSARFKNDDFWDFEEESV
ncbi:uncharacterized protein MONBRDRAFT_34322 [Monosiga brevicollis MX1]|uniref:Uncharacterized protein n=1 Tax=Monosiga brevicollis TaxID=81824 RepID=A9VAY0_MONBE|nr:uncharacterized protein MONBRDRAFT_34322 [Monosiga brevicollis MX1]EDQ85295.1 predicted protein [Monosiga brevicollis MX1]|eukprot:XP_001749916.1 hypothetical protein [Monosiga brevicollis MX1]